MSGADLFTQFVYGAQVSLFSGPARYVHRIGVGLVVGLMAGYLGRLVDEVLMRFHGYDARDPGSTLANRPSSRSRPFLMEHNRSL